MKRLFNAGRIIGEKLISQREGGIGIITNAYEENGRLWAVVNDNYELDVSSCEVIYNITNGDHFVKVDNLISKSVQFIDELLADVLGFYKGGVSGDAFGFGSAEVFEVIPRRMDLKDVGTNNLRMQSPYSLDTTRIRLGVVFVEVITISECEGDDAGFIEHPQEFGAGWANKAAVHSGFDFATGFADEEDGFHLALQPS